MFPSLCLSSPYKFVLEIEILFFVCAGRIQSAYAGGESSFAWKCCKGASISYHSIEPANVDELEGWLCTSSGDVCFLSTTGTDDVGMESAIETCYGYEAHVCLWEDMMMLCGSGHNPYESMSSGWYGDHGISSGGDYDDEYGTWSADHCASNNDGTARAASESFGFRCCRGARLELPQLDCPANSAGVDILDGCLCGPGYSGSIALSQTEPYYSGDCVAVTCPANSEGADLPSGCNCSAGFGGTIAASQTVPYYTGVCGELVPPSMSDCSALNFMGTTDENERYATRPELVAPTAFDSADPDSAGGVELAVVALTGDLIVTNTTQFPYDAVTVVRFVATDSSGLTASCEITVTILDDQPPVLEDCSGLNINGTTDEGAGYGTIQTGRVSLVYPTAQDNSGEVLTAVATVNGSTVALDTAFPAGSVTVVYVATDSAGLYDSCSVTVTITISPSPRYTMALAVDYATLEEDGEAYTAFSLSFREALAITISINPARIILTSIAPYADRRQLQSSGTEDEAAGDSTGVLLEFYVDPPEGDASDDSLTPAAAIEQLIEAAATGELEEVLATEAQIVLVPGSLGLTVETAVGVDEGRGTLTVGFLPLSTSSTECSVESGTDEKELADHVFNYPRGMTASDGWLYITDNNLISRMQSESSDYPESGPQKMVGDGSESRHSGNRDGVRFAPPHHRSSVCERRLTRSVGVCCRHTPQVGFTTPARLRWQSTR